MPDRRRRDAGADKIAKLLLAAIAADRFGRMTLQHRVGRCQIEALDVAPARRVEAEGQAALARKIGKAPADLQRVEDLPGEVIDRARSSARPG